MILLVIQSALIFFMNEIKCLLDLLRIYCVAMSGDLLLFRDEAEKNSRRI